MDRRRTLELLVPPHWVCSTLILATGLIFLNQNRPHENRLPERNTHPRAQVFGDSKKSGSVGKSEVLGTSNLKRHFNGDIDSLSNGYHVVKIPLKQLLTDSGFRWFTRDNSQLEHDVIAHIGLSDEICRELQFIIDQTIREIHAAERIHSKVFYSADGNSYLLRSNGECLTAVHNQFDAKISQFSGNTLVGVIKNAIWEQIIMPQICDDSILSLEISGSEVMVLSWPIAAHQEGREPATWSGDLDGGFENLLMQRLGHLIDVPATIKNLELGGSR